MRKNITALKKRLSDLAFNLIPSLIAGAVIEISKTYNLIYDWLGRHNLTVPFVLIPIFIVSVALLILAAASWWFKGRKNVKLHKAIPPLLFLCSVILLVNSLHIILIKPPQKFPVTYHKITPEALWERHTVDLPIDESFRTLSLRIKCPEGEGLSLFPELELEKISPLEGDWASLIEEDSAEKLAISGLETAEPNEYYYRPRNGEFEVHDTGGNQVSLNRRNKIRVNVRNFAEFNETIELYFYGIKTQGAKK